MIDYFNPVKVVKSDNWKEELINYIKDYQISSPLIITSKGTRKRLFLDSLLDSGFIFDDIQSHPTLSECNRAIEYCNDKSIDGLVAIGGGSVMDMAKVIMAHLNTNINEVRELISYRKNYKKKINSIFLPTTHGTASEVTMWGTLWDKTENKKYSISNIGLYPTCTILDPSLTISLPLDTSIITVMDALSHSFEAIWNKNANEKSTSYAIEAIILILNNIDKLKSNPMDLIVRNNLLIASNLAGLAFSNTKTAAAHSISYPLTIYYGIPHGIASSITLIPLLDLCADKINGPIKKIILDLGMNSIEDLKEKIKKIPDGYLKFHLSEWNIAQRDYELIIKKSFTKDRMDNFIHDIDATKMTSILKSVQGV